MDKICRSLIFIGVIYFLGPIFHFRQTLISKAFLISKRTLDKGVWGGGRGIYAEGRWNSKEYGHLEQLMTRYKGWKYKNKTPPALLNTDLCGEIYICKHTTLYSITSPLPKSILVKICTRDLHENIQTLKTLILFLLECNSSSQRLIWEVPLMVNNWHL